MQENTCPQCDQEVLPPSNRLVQDACGHIKCRCCLLGDEIRCKQCQIINGAHNIPKTIYEKSNYKISNAVEENIEPEGYSIPTHKTIVQPVQIENHTAVIQCNGKPKVALSKVNYGQSLNHKTELKTEPKEVVLKTKLKKIEYKGAAIAHQAENKVFHDLATKELNFNTEFKTPLNANIKLKDFKSPSTEYLRHKTFKKEPGLEKKTSIKKKKNLEIPKHITVSTEPLSFRCNLCDKSFKTKGHVKYHRFCTGENRPFRCHLCGRDFILRTQLELHKIKHGGEKPHSCNICQRSFHERSKLKRHMLVHTDEKKFMCTECGKTFRTREALHIHVSIHKGEKHYPCDMCSAKFNNSSNLKRHAMSHSTKKVHMCDLCGKTFKLKDALKVHRKSHTRIRDFQCEVCLKTFVLNKELQRHILTHNDSTNYACSLCGTSFRRKDNLYRHMKNTHPGKKAEVIITKRTESRPTEPKPKTINRPPVVVADNPNAINVITASPAFIKSKTLSAVAMPRDESNVDIVDSRSVVDCTGYNGPPKLAFKGPAFKMHYNIKRDGDYIHPAQVPHPINLSESVDICQKIMSPSTDYICPTSSNIDQKTSTAICQKILCVDDVSNQDKLVESLPVHQTKEYAYRCKRRVKAEPGLEGDLITEDAEIDVLSPYTDSTEKTECQEPLGENCSAQEVLGIQAPIPIKLSESVNIYQTIMSPSTDYTDPTRNVDDRTFTETCQRILLPPEILPTPAPIPLSESVNICQKIMSPSTDYTDPTKNVDDQTFKETCKRIFLPPSETDLPPKFSDKNVTFPNKTTPDSTPSPYFSSPRSDISQYSNPGISPRPGLPQYTSTLHYSSSFQNQKHAVIKSIKFKVPLEYTKSFKEQQNSREDSNKTAPSSLNLTSVIVNNSNNVNL